MKGFPAIAAWVLAVGLAIAWLVVSWFGLGGATAQMGLVLGAIGLSLAAGAVSLMSGRGESQKLAGRLDDLISMTGDQSCGPFDQIGATWIGSGASSDHSNPESTPKTWWEDRVLRLAESVQESAFRIEDLKSDRNVYDIRCRRALARVAKVEAVLTELGEPVLVINDYGDLVLANHAARELLGIEVDLNEPVAIESLVLNRRICELLRATIKRKAGKQRTDEMSLVDSDGNTRWFRVSTSRLHSGIPSLEIGGATVDTASMSAESSESRSQSSDINSVDFGREEKHRKGKMEQSGGAVAVFQDISDRRQLQRRGAEFVSSVSHEMKAPLASIAAYTELLISGDVDDDEDAKNEFLEAIDTQTKRLTRLVENLLNLARIEAGVVNVNKLNQSLNEILEEAANVIQPQAEAKHIELKTDLSPMYLGVLADRDMMLQTAINLLSNAVKYTADGGEVILRSRMVDDHVRFEVKDTGVGLSEEDRQRVFDKFYRVKSNSEMAPGTGLGLPLAKHIVEDVHGGEMTVASSLGDGSTFSVVIPGAGQMA